MPLPNFIIIGAQKAGTSSMHATLSKHPDICMPQTSRIMKELHFFNRSANYERGISFYEEQFSHCRFDSVIGEVTPNYMVSEVACERISRHLPDVKLIACLRHPVDRAYSQYWMERTKDGLLLSFEAAIERRGEFLERGRYASQLKRFLARFRCDQLHVCFFENMKKNPFAFYTDLFDFIGVKRPEHSNWIHESHVYKGGRPRMSIIPAVIRLATTLYSPFKHLLIERPVGDYLSRKIQSAKLWVTRANSIPGYPPMEAETRMRLLESFYKDNLELSYLVGGIPDEWSK